MFDYITKELEDSEDRTFFITIFKNKWRTVYCIRKYQNREAKRTFSKRRYYKYDR